MVRTFMLKMYALGFVSSIVLVGFLSTGSTSAAACTITVTNTSSSGAGSFTQALSDANAASDMDVICFSIGTGQQTINLTVQLGITQPVEIDGTTQPGYSGTPLIELYGGSANGLVVSSSGNTISAIAINGYAADGLLLQGTGGNTVVGSYFGLGLNGTSDRGNGASGIGVLSPNNTIGGSTAAERNVISGNGGNGLVIGGAAASGNVVEGNYFGTNAAGTGAVPNVGDGLLINDAPSNTIGGTTSVSPTSGCMGSCNLFSGNDANGVGIWHSGASSNVVKGNYIGVKVDGQSALANGDIGLEIQDAANNMVGGVNINDRNLISGNLGAGVSITGIPDNGFTTQNNTILGNYIGVNRTGNAAIKNHKMGVNLGTPGGGTSAAQNNIIGGTSGVSLGGSCTGSCNIIAGNGWNGIYISGSDGGSNQISGNFIGVGASGGWTIPNLLDGVGIVDSPNNKLGGSSSSARNLISGNGGYGIAIVGNSSTGTRIEKNYIGVATDTNAMPNQKSGVGVAAGVDTAILTNSIYANGWLGIDLAINGITPNDGGDPDGGPNRLQNYPVLNYAYSASGNTTVSGSLNSHGSTAYTVQFFSSPSCNNGAHPGYGQGHTYLGSKIVSTSLSGNVSFTASFNGLTDSGKAVTATATKMYNGSLYETSEFSKCVQIPRQHPDGTVVSPAGSPNLFMIENGKTRQIGSVEVLQSHNINTSEIKTATTSDTTFPGGSGLYFKEGTVLKGSNLDIYFIDQISENSYIKRKLTSGAAFNALGYTINDVIVVPDSALGLSSGASMNTSAVHPDGTLVKSPSRTVYIIESGKKRLIGSPGVFVSHRLKETDIKWATGGDLAMSSGANLLYREGTLVKGSAPTVYVIDEVSGINKKRNISTINAFIELEYTANEVITIPDNELPSSNGPSV
jgi:hypothetical protein